MKLFDLLTEIFDKPHYQMEEIHGDKFVLDVPNRDDFGANVSKKEYIGNLTGGYLQAAIIKQEISSDDLVTHGTSFINILNGVTEHVRGSNIGEHTLVTFDLNNKTFDYGRSFELFKMITKTAKELWQDEKYNDNIENYNVSPSNAIGDEPSSWEHQERYGILTRKSVIHSVGKLNMDNKKVVKTPVSTPKIQKYIDLVQMIIDSYPAKFRDLTPKYAFDFSEPLILLVD